MRSNKSRRRRWSGQICGESAPPLGRVNKYRNKKTVVDGITFDSRREASRYGALKIMQAAGVISNLRLQVPYVITVNGHKICRYVADFVYQENGREVVEDVKGVRTREYILKRKLMFAVFGIEIKEVK